MIPRKMITLGDDVLEGVSGGYDDRHVGEWICCGFGVWIDQKGLDNAVIVDGKPCRWCDKCQTYTPIKVWTKQS